MVVVADERLRDSQKWVNAKYKGVSGYIACAEDGLPGWETMFSLTRALQVELGITALSDSFGPTTLSRLTSRVGNVSSSTSNHNVVAILQCALWCKGYAGDVTYGTFSQTVANSVASIRTDMGLSAAASVTPKMFKSILTMDAYIRVGTGTELVRSIQKWLNARYNTRADYFIAPCDGSFSRDVQTALMLAIQYEIGMADGVANGNFGPGTQQGLKDYGAVALGTKDSSKHFVSLFQAALIFNGYTVPFDGNFATSTETQVKAFQSFAQLSVSAKGDYQTWASLLVSTGDPTRSVTVCDTGTPLTATTAASLYASGYRIVGRYLSVLENRYQPGEMAAIFAAGLKTFPIYQNGNDSASAFSEAIGYNEGKAAALRARQLGIKGGAIIYFAIDYDATNDELDALVIPHYRGLKKGVAASRTVSYKIGVYGTRNAATRLAAAGLTVSSMVSDQSTGYSGNLGFALPKDWAYDQIVETSNGSAPNSIPVDNDVVSSRAVPLTSSNVSPTPIIVGPPAGFDEYFWVLEQMQVEAEASSGGYSYSSATGYNDVVLLWMQKGKYWTAAFKAYTPALETAPGTAGTSYGTAVALMRSTFEAAVAKWTPIRPTETTFPTYAGDPEHFAASARGYLAWGAPSASTACEVGDLGGWALDLASLWAQYVVARRVPVKQGGTQINIKTWFAARIGTSAASNFGRADLIADIDAYLAARRISAGTPIRNVSDVMRDILVAAGKSSKWRPTTFISERFGTSANIAPAVKDLFLNHFYDVPRDRGANGERSPGNPSNPPVAGDPTGTELAGELNALATSFADALNSFAKNGL